MFLFVYIRQMLLEIKIWFVKLVFVGSRGMRSLRDSGFLCINRKIPESSASQQPVAGPRTSFLAQGNTSGHQNGVPWPPTAGVKLGLCWEEVGGFCLAIWSSGGRKCPSTVLSSVHNGHP